MKKNLIATLLVMKKEKNLDNLTLEKLTNRNYKLDLVPNQVL